MGARSPSRGADAVPRAASRSPFAADLAMAELASRQHGVVSRSQLLAAGLSPRQVARRMQSGRLHRVHAGVYRVGHVADSEWVRERAALLACGSGAVLSHRSAAKLWELGFDDRKIVEVTIAGEWARAHAGVAVRTTTALARRDVRRMHGLAATGPARTLLDLGLVVPAERLEQAVAEAYARRLVSESELRAQLNHRFGHRGTRSLRLLLERDAGPALTLSEAERKLLALIRSAGLPEPETNVRVGPYMVDFLWRRQRVIVEVDGYAFHFARRQFERDRDRTNDLQVQGYLVLRFTWRQLVNARSTVVTRLRRALLEDAASTRTRSGTT